MTKRDSALTRARILRVAEQLFAEKGFDGSRVDEIARGAGVNKALIYYYFKSKDDILDALFTSAIKDVIELIEQTYDDFQLDEDEVEQMFNTLVDLVSRKKRILKVMLMESLKGSERRPHLFKIADYFVGGEVDTLTKLFESRGLQLPRGIDRKQMLVTEFFTGMMPLINYVVYREEWCRHVGMDEAELKKRFFRALAMTHLLYHKNLLEGN
ncbi:MAG: TetR family transcriptional regulator [Chitinivibrionales bacterium]|nr:TetR family transcriptional regulator [Chitinivibrionales bacterium]